MKQVKQFQSLTRLAVLCVFCGWTAGCGSSSQEGRTVSDSLRPLYQAHYAERFELLENAQGVPIFRVHNPWQGVDSVVMEYRLVACSSADTVLRPDEIRWPIRRAVCMSSSHVAFLDAIGQTKVVRGVSGLDFITNPIVRADSTVCEVGYEQNLNYETIVAMQPDVLFIYAVAGDNSSVVRKLQQLNIPVIYIADYLENNPLGRAEWIVPFGLLTGRMNQAIHRFQAIDSSYRTLRDLVSERNYEADGRQPRVMLNTPYRDVWYLPGDRSYMVQLLRDAGAEYLGRGEDSDVSRPVSSEQALLLLMKADYWLNPGTAQSIEQLKIDNRRFASLPVVTAGKVYNNNARITPAGGSDFWESGVVYPEVILRDLLHILHPELQLRDELYYFHQLE